MRGIPDYLSNTNYNPNHSDWYPGKRSKEFYANWERIFRKKETQKENNMGCGKPKPKPR